MFSPLKWLLRLVIGFFVSTLLVVLIYRWVPVYYTPLMAVRCAQQKLQGRPFQLQRIWVNSSKISPNMKLAVVCAEDQNFVNHFGFDYHAIENAYTFNKSHTRKRGASTISQQTAKNVFLWPGRSFIRKAFEVYFTFLIECIWGKQRILEVYLNVIEVGDGQYGCGIASQKYFRQTPDKITEAQAALIAAVLPNPRKFLIAAPSEYTLARRSWILQQMGNYNSKLNPIR